jgi:hypothetical protein
MRFVLFWVMSIFKMREFLDRATRRSSLTLQHTHLENREKVSHEPRNLQLGRGPPNLSRVPPKLSRGPPKQVTNIFRGS